MLVIIERISPRNIWELIKMLRSNYCGSNVTYIHIYRKVYMQICIRSHRYVNVPKYLHTPPHSLQMYVFTIIFNKSPSGSPMLGHSQTGQPPTVTWLGMFQQRWLIAFKFKWSRIEKAWRYAITFLQNTTTKPKKQLQITILLQFCPLTSL